MTKRNHRSIRMPTACGPTGKPVKLQFIREGKGYTVLVREHRSHRPLRFKEQDFIDRVMRIYRQADLPAFQPQTHKD